MAKLALHHHERLDGEGYPDRKKGEEIPIGSRIIAVADAFDAMVSNRPYRQSLTLMNALREIRDDLRSHFDPRLPGCLRGQAPRGIWRRLADNHSGKRPRHLPRW